jgi:hypothetical protein
MSSIQQAAQALDLVAQLAMLDGPLQRDGQHVDLERFGDEVVRASADPATAVSRLPKAVILESVQMIFPFETVNRRTSSSQPLAAGLVRLISRPRLCPHLTRW